MGLAMNSMCLDCPEKQECPQWTGFGYEFDKQKCKIYTARNVLVNRYFEEDEVTDGRL